MQQHQHAHQHGPQCRHDHTNAHSHHSLGNSFLDASTRNNTSQEYLSNLRGLYSSNRLFFWSEVLSGNTLNIIYDKYGLEALKTLNCNYGVMLIKALEMFLNFNWVPLRLRPFVSGLFFPIFFFFFFSFNIVIGIGNDHQFLRYCIYTTMLLYVCTALRGSGNLKNQNNINVSKKLIQIRPYLMNPQKSCQLCKVIKPYRSVHCPMCFECIPKFTRHSLVFGACIGAANQLLAFLFFCTLLITECIQIFLFWKLTSYGLLTQLMFYSLNLSILWSSIVQIFSLFIFNFYYGCTEHEIRVWPSLPYLVRMPLRQFQNNCDSGIFNNIKQSLLACFDIAGIEKPTNEAITPQNPWNFLPLQSNKIYTVNWNRALFHLLPQFPNIKNRNTIIQLLRRDEPRMLQSFRLQQRFRQQVIKQQPDLNEMQIQQQTAIKLQAHMMKNCPQMMPTIEQQKSIQLQMLAHMKRQLADKPDFVDKFTQLETKLFEGKMLPIEVNLAMRELQQEFMGSKIQAVMKQKSSLQQPELHKKPQEEEQGLKKELRDEDL